MKNYNNYDPNNPNNHDLNYSNQYNNEQNNMPYYPPPTYNDFQNNSLYYPYNAPQDNNSPIEKQDSIHNSWTANNEYTPPQNATSFSRIKGDTVNKFINNLQLPQKVGYQIISKKFVYFYKISLLDFIPLFIGMFLSFIKACISYGDISKNYTYDRKQYFDSKVYFVIVVVDFFFISPLIYFLIITLLFPLIVFPTNDVIKVLDKMGNELFVQGNFSAFVNTYLNDLFFNLFLNVTQLAITCSVFGILSTLNFKTIIYRLIFKIKRSVVFEKQKKFAMEIINNIQQNI